MIIKSHAFNDGSNIPGKYSYYGENNSPPIEFSEIPDDTKSIALICHDPDAPGPEGFTHWLMWNISPDDLYIEENTIPENAEVGLNDWNEIDWGGPAPPSGTHNYNFYAFALDQILELPPNTKRKELLEALEPHVIDRGVLTGKYSA